MSGQSPRVHQLNAASFKITCVASRHCGNMSARDGCNLAVELTDRAASSAALGRYGRISFGGGAVKWQDTAAKIFIQDAFYRFGEPVRLSPKVNCGGTRMGSRAGSARSTRSAGAPRARIAAARLRGAEPSDVTRRSMSRASSSIEWPRSAARTRRRCMISSARLRIVMLAMAVISVSVGAANVIADFNDINAIERPSWLPKLPSGGVEKWCLTPFHPQAHC